MTLINPIQTPALTNTQAMAVSYLQGIALEERRQAGQTYTPLHIVQFIFDLAGYNPDEAIETKNLLDPACGGGIFLEVAVMLLASRLKGLGVDFNKPDGHKFLLYTISQRLFGVDLDASACTLTRQAVREAIARVSSGSIPEGYFDSNVRHADFLLFDDLDTFLPCEGLHFVIGNPPYVQTTRLETEHKNKLRQRFLTAYGRLDLYTLFIERAMPLLNNHGQLAFITPDKFMASLSSASLRKLIIQQGSMKSVARFTSHKVFESAAMIPCITVFEKATLQGEIHVFDCGDQVTPDGKVTVLQRYTLPSSKLNGSTWELHPPSLDRLAEYIKAQHRTLEQVTTRISAGVATGRNEVYIIPATTEIDIEPELLRRVIRGEDIGTYQLRDPNLNLLIPYSYNAGRQRQLVHLDDYPRTKAYLECFKPDLLTRQVVKVKGQPWYAHTDPPKFDLATLPKILVPDIAEHNRFAFDSGHFFPLNSAYYVLPKGINPYFLTAVLNSTPIEFLIRLKAPIAKDRFSRYRQQFLAPLPIPEVEEVIIEEIAQAALQKDVELADRLCTALFNLTNSDIIMMNRFLGRID